MYLRGIGGLSVVVRIDVREQTFDHRIVPVEAVGEQRDHLAGDLAEHAHLVARETRHVVIINTAEHVIQ